MQHGVGEPRQVPEADWERGHPVAGEQPGDGEAAHTAARTGQYGDGRALVGVRRADQPTDNAVALPEGFLRARRRLGTKP